MDPVQPAREFPFNPTLTHTSFPTPHGMGDSRRHPGYIHPGLEALIFSAINLLLFILTLFVVPFIVLEQKTIRESVVGSFTLMKKNWERPLPAPSSLELLHAVCSLRICLSRLHPGWSHQTGLSSIRPGNTWIALALVYDLCIVLFCDCNGNGWRDCRSGSLQSAKSRQIAAKSTEPTGVVI